MEKLCLHNLRTAESKDSQVIKASYKGHCGKMVKHHKSSKRNAEYWVKENQAIRWKQQPEQATKKNQVKRVLDPQLNH